MRHLASTTVAFAAGAALMYLLDPAEGARRRAAMLAWLRQDPAAEPMDGAAMHRAHTDAQLRDRVRLQLGRMVSYPRAIHVQVQDSVVRLSGDVLAAELDGLLTRVLDIEGVRKVANALSTHSAPNGWLRRQPLAAV